MSPEMGRRLTLLLVMAIVLQVWTLLRQAGLESRLAQLSADQSTIRQRIHSDIDSLEQQLRAMAEADRWISPVQIAVEPGSDCRGAAVTVSWQLHQWSDGTVARLQYRQHEDEPWQEARVQDLGGQSYSATLTVSGTPEWQPQVDVAHRGQSGQNQGVAARVVEDTAAGPRLQYRILAEGPGLSRGTGVESIFLGKVFARPLPVQVEVGPDGHYGVAVILPAPDSRGCLEITGGAVRAYAGDQLVSTAALAPEPRGGATTALAARWQDQRPLGRLVIDLDLASGGRLAVPVGLSGR